jgi:hypothetical protein
MTLSAPEDDARQTVHPEPVETQSTEGQRALILPEFTPVPRERMRRGGWSAERQRKFIELLAETGSVRAACRRMGVGEHHIYKLRRHPEAESFRRAWEAALDCGIARIEDVAMDRALHGVEQPVYSYGELVGTRQVYNDRLLMFMLRNRSPDRFGGGAPRSPNAVDRMQQERLKKRWLREWEAEQAEKSREDSRAVIARIDAKFKLMAERRRARMSPRTLAAERAFHQALTEDRQGRAAHHAHPLLPGVDWPLAWGPGEEAEPDADWNDDDDDE